MPPPLDTPDNFVSPDTKMYKMFKEDLEYKLKIDNGDAVKPPFEIVNGKKVYDRFAGVNQPINVDIESAKWLI